ncbi:MAG: lipopolysaccharide biosynthesis protein [Anaerolineaceae bacterium]|nr:lipopolysaccharide biosynthesis protein [Anaerolineaceae bacterium]
MIDSQFPEPTTTIEASIQDPPQPAAQSLTSKTLHGLKWSYVDTAVNAVLQIGYTAVMARLLSPVDFGLVAMANVVLRFGSYFAQMGVGSALVQKKDLSSEDIRAGFTSSLLLALLVFGVFYLAAPLATFIFNDSAVVPVVRVLALSFVLGGLSITSLSLLRRSLAFRSIAIIDIISFVLGYGGGGIFLALKGFGVWSLVAAALSQSAILALLAYLFTRHSVALILDWKYFKRLYGFGGRVTLISFMEFISSNLDTLSIGHFIGAAALGIYNRAFMLVNLPMYYLVTSFSRVLMPSYSRIQDDLPRLKKGYLSSIMLVGSLLVPICWGLSAASQEVVLLVLGEKWRAAIPVLQILAFATPFDLLSHLAAFLLEAAGVLNVKMLIQSFYICFLATLFFFLNKWGVVGFAMALVVGELSVLIAYTFVMRRFLKISRLEFWSAYQPAVFSGVIISLLIFGVGFLLRLSGAPVWFAFLLEVTIGAIVWLFSFSLARPQKMLRSEAIVIFHKIGAAKSTNSRVSKFLSRLRIVFVDRN